MWTQIYRSSKVGVEFAFEPAAPHDRSTRFRVTTCDGSVRECSSMRAATALVTEFETEPN